MQRKSTAERFWSHVDKSGECWLWTGYRDGGGYGRFQLGGRNQPSHRVAYSLTHGTVPDGMDVCHTCDIPPCVHPSHLFLGTALDNMRDASTKGRMWRGGQPPLKRGQDNGHRKLTEAEVRQIWTRLTGRWGERGPLAQKYGVSIQTIHSIAEGRNWGWLTSSL